MPRQPDGLFIRKVDADAGVFQANPGQVCADAFTVGGDGLQWSFPFFVSCASDTLTFLFQEYNRNDFRLLSKLHKIAISSASKWVPVGVCRQSELDEFLPRA